jgi:flagellar biosynthesis protein FlhB
MADEQRTERATPRRRNQAAERGQTTRSRDFPSALTLLGVAALLHAGADGLVPSWKKLFGSLLAISAHGETRSLAPLINMTAISTARWMAPPLLLAWLVAAAGLFLQGGFVFAPAAFSPNFNRLNPANNLSRLFSPAGLSPLLRSFIPVSALIYLAVTIVSSNWLALLHSSQIGLPAAMSWLYQILYQFAWKGGLILLVWASADYGIQKWNYERSLRMTKQEVRDEGKDVEGNPQTRGRIRRKMREMRRKHMLKQVRRATVVITNPDEFAVALEYIPDQMAAPVVLAKGRNELAQKIKREARWHEIPIVENPPLAQALYKAVDIGQQIPAKLYTAVAEVLAFIYRAQQRVRAEAANRAKRGPGGAPSGGSGPARGR